MSDRTKWIAFLVLILAAWFGGDNPAPPPDPRPPVVVEDVEWVVIVEQSEERSLDVAKLIASGWLDTIELKYRVFDYDSEAAKSYRSLADSDGMPLVLLQDAAGNVLRHERLDVARLKEMVK